MDALFHAFSSGKKMHTVRFENQPIPFFQNFLYQLHKHTRSNGAILGKSDHEKMAISMLDFANKMPSYCEKDTKLVTVITDDSETISRSRVTACAYAAA